MVYIQHTRSMLSNNRQPATHTVQPLNPNVDLLNLYVKNLDDNVTNDDLYNHFKKFGRIVSARVMSYHGTGQSKGFGFVSYGKPEEASAALREMHGKVIGSKPLSVTYHEPRKGRHRLPVAFQLENQPSIQQDSNHAIVSHQPPVTVAHPSGSRPVSRLSPSASPFHPMSNGHLYHDMQSMCAAMSGLGIQQGNPAKDWPVPPKRRFSGRKLKNGNYAESPMFGARISTPFSSSHTSCASSGPTLATLSSRVGTHASPPQPYYRQRNTNPLSLRRRGSVGSVNSYMTESSANLQRQRLTQAVVDCGQTSQSPAEIVDMLLTLGRRERSLCLFNQGFLREKIQLAVSALEACNKEDINQEPAREQHTSNIKLSSGKDSVSPDVSDKVREMQDKLRAMEGQPDYEIKQLIGDHLFPLVKATGVKMAPKVTIRLLDSVDLHKLVHIMYDDKKLTEYAVSVFAALKKQQ